MVSPQSSCMYLHVLIRDPITNGYTLLRPLKTIMKNLKKAERERGASQRAETHDTPQQQDPPEDPAILSVQSKPEAGHLSRLLGGLSNQSTPVQPSTPVTISSRTANGGALPTPQATPSVASATKVDLPTNCEHPAVPKRVKQHPVFASPTPPHSGDSTKSCGNDQPPKSKFEFVSPFDALASPPKKRTEARLSAQRLPPVAEVATSAPTSTLNDATAASSETPSGVKPGRPRAPSATEHFAPPSIARARVRSRQPSQSSSASITSPTSSAAIPSPLPEGGASIQPKLNLLTPSKQAKHAALLQSLANDLFSKSSNSTPAPALGNNSVFMDHRSGTVSPSVLPPVRQPNALTQKSGTGNGGLFPLANGMNAYVAPTSLHSISQVQVNGNSYISNSRSVTPKITYPPSDGGGPGSPIPVVPPANPLQRDQLLALLNGENGRSVTSQQPQAPFVPHLAMVPPQLARNQHRHSLRPLPVAVGGPILHGVPTVLPLSLAAASSGGESFQTAAPVPTPSAPPNPDLLSILNQPFPYR